MRHVIKQKSIGSLHLINWKARLSLAGTKAEAAVFYVDENILYTFAKEREGMLFGACVEKWRIG